MPQTTVAIFRDDDGTAPLVDWFEELSSKVQDKCRLKIERLKELGNELRRPEADYLRDGIYELRVRQQRVNYRMLYFFNGRHFAVLSHGLAKEKAVPPKEIERAIQHQEKFKNDPKKHTYEEGK